MSAVEGSAMLTSFINFCGQGAPIASIGCYLAPIPTIRDVTMTGTVGSLPLLPYSAMVSNAFMWTIYGVLKKEYALWSCNGVGCVLAAYYCLQFTSHIPKAKQTSILQASTPTLPGTVQQHAQAVAAVIGITSLMAIFQPFANTANLIGNVAVLFCILMFASPLSVIRVVLQTKSAKSIPLPFTVLTCVNCFMWVIFGWFKLNDVNVYLPNILGLTFGLIQVALKVQFGDKDGLPMSTSGIAP
ncbi:Bidirectional sugar transporter SWEET15 [Seminavis robusta]|uniref:Sugar transporter SWEET1 n=1 Tax=Seminavis robusta TaxID=568900 RepID=A0A9N8EKI3_9STRA|nr:Bidirectional sugar transporter SWEET15 [Seminavis robusta]|eukprot:Sro1149_g246590.1 Bidirectional sugar transporter SWEET15 (243) ;mRNA; r:27474-28395